MKNNGSFKNAGSSRAKMWRNILDFFEINVEKISNFR